MTGTSTTGAVLIGLGALHLVYTYAMYPWLVRQLPRRAPKPGLGGRAPDLVSVVIAARIQETEVQGLVDKVSRLVGTIWLPSEVVVAVDDSGAADALSEAFATIRTTNGRVHMVRVPRNAGKAVALNRAVDEARGDVLVFTDVRQDIQPGAVEDLIRTLSSPDIGAVAGALALDPGGRPDGLYERYWRFERNLRAREAAWDSAVGVSGALYALRRELWRPLPAGLILDDLWVPMHAVRMGKRVAFAPGAIATDRGASSDAGELARKVRTLTGNYQLLLWMPWLLNPLRNRIWWQFMSHKVMRLLTPLAVACCVTGAVVAAPVASLAGVAALAVAVMVGSGRRSLGPGVGTRGALRSATVLIAALVVAALNALRGHWDVWEWGGTLR